MAQKVIPVEEADYLTQDPPIRGQKYCCISFISPEDVIKSKEAFFFQKFLKAFSFELDDLFTKASETYKDNPDFVDGLSGIKERYNCLFDSEKVNEEYSFYKATHGDALESEYLEKNQFQTSIRGFKVRGSYDSLKEAQIRCQVLKRLDDNFNVYVAEVGCWCPWSPNPEELEKQEYSESHLNTLVKQYMDNQKQKDEFFLERKQHLTEKARTEGASNQTTIKEEPVEEELQEEDPWLQRKQENADGASTSTAN